jgi:hypothetical protein
MRLTIAYIYLRLSTILAWKSRAARSGDRQLLARSVSTFLLAVPPEALARATRKSCRETKRLEVF